FALAPARLRPCAIEALVEADANARLARCVCVLQARRQGEWTTDGNVAIGDGEIELAPCKPLVHFNSLAIVLRSTIAARSPAFFTISQIISIARNSGSTT